MANINNGDYTSWLGISEHFANNNNTFKKRAIDDVGTSDSMPPPDAAEFQKLTPEEFNLINCWIESGFLEN